MEKEAIFESLKPSQPKAFENNIIDDFVFEKLSLNSCRRCEDLFVKAKNYAKEKGGENNMVYKPFPDLKSMLLNSIVYGINSTEDKLLKENKSLIGIIGLKKMSEQPINDIIEKNIETIPIINFWKDIIKTFPSFYAGSLLLDPNFRGQNLGDFIMKGMMDKCKEMNGKILFAEINPLFLLSRKPLVKYSYLSFTVQHQVMNMLNLFNETKETLLTQDITILDKDLADKMKECFYMDTKTKFEYTEENVETLKAGILGESKKDPLVGDDEIIIWEKEVVNYRETLVPYKIKFDVEKMKEVVEEFEQKETEKQIMKNLEDARKQLEKLRKSKNIMTRTNSSINYDEFEKFAERVVNRRNSDSSSLLNK